jgi:hypothetical protein
MPRQTVIRSLVRIRTVVEGIDPPIIRELLVDREAHVGQLALAVKAAFGLSRCERHEFRDTRDPSLPADTCLAEWSEEEAYEHDRYLRKQWPTRQPERRWGDRWTMIDSRDPRMTFETSVAVTQLFRARYPWEAPRIPTVFFRCDSVDPYSTWRAGRPWWLRLELIGEDIEAVSAQLASVAGGSGATPFDSDLGAHAFARVLARWRDGRLPEHSDARALVARTMGPWATFDPDNFELEVAQTDVAAALHEVEPLPAGARRLLESVPATVQPGLRRHLTVHGVGLSPVITARQAESAVSSFRHALIDVIGADGRPIDAAEVDMAGMLGGAEIAAAFLELLRRLRLIYRRSGSWRVKRDVLKAASDPLALWHRLAREVDAFLHGDARLLLLTIADGTIADEDAALQRLAALHATPEHVEEEWGIGFSTRRPAMADLGDARATLGELRGILMHLLPEGERDGNLAASETVREFARTCLQ